MIKSMKIRLKPNKEQEVLMFKSIGCSRFAYNWALNRWSELYEEGLNPSKLKIKKEFNNTVKKNSDYSWLYEVSSQTIAQAFDDLSIAFKRFFNKIAGYPDFKSKKNSKQSFYVRYDAVKFENGRVNLEKIGKVKYKTNYNIPKLDKYINPRCFYDGKYWYLTVGFEQNENQVSLNFNLSVGIDLGVKYLAVINSIEKPIININRTYRVKLLKSRLKKYQRRLSRKYEANKNGEIYIKTNNIIKLQKKIKLLQRRINNIRDNHIHQATSKIIKLRPYRVVMEDLNIAGMMKNKYIAPLIREQKFYEFARQMEYKCCFNNIKFVKIDRFYPSSKKCSSCGNIKTNLRLKDRLYICSNCGLSIDRDKNASINIGNYGLV